jgi:hypothetical protein
VAELDPAGLARPDQIAHSPLLQVQLGDVEAVLRRREGAQPVEARPIAQENAIALLCTPADPAAELVQLSEPEALGMLHQHHRRVGHVDAHLDHRGGHQDLDLAGAEPAHGVVALVRLQAAVHQAHSQVGPARRECPGHARGGPEIGPLRLLDDRQHHVGLPAALALLTDELHHLLPLIRTP